MTLDTLSQVLKTECCWVQTVDTRKWSLSLAAHRGFSPEMRHEMTRMDIDHCFSKQIIGMGNEIVIPDLSNDGRYGLLSFPDAGYKWMVAAPLMTYRVHGILGIASRNRRRLYKQTPELIKVIAGLIGTALIKARLIQKSPAPLNPAKTKDKEETATPATPDDKKPAPSNQSVDAKTSPDITTKKPPEGTFHKHADKMRSFRSSHR